VIRSAGFRSRIRVPAARALLTGDREAARDALSRAQRKKAKSFLDAVCRDFEGKRISLAKLTSNVSMDYDATGMGYIEVSRLETSNEVIGLYHIPSPMIRKRLDGTFVQIDQVGRAVAFFRQFLSRPGDETSRHTVEEAIWSGQESGSIKNELVEFRRYHPRELYYGIPPIVAALSNLYGNIFSDDRNLRFFVNRALPDWIVEIKASRSTLLDPQSKIIIDQYEQALREHLQNVIQGDDYRCLVIRLPNDEIETVWTKLSTEVKDLPDAESRCDRPRLQDAAAPDRDHREREPRIGDGRVAGGDVQERADRSAPGDVRDLLQRAPR
jgi:hypothetical protein